ncbi:MAG: hypothetical protein EAZ53_08760 [Bacteroidetes bacterium]|nr:MAG: hypothetical protein EAZ53_08760 [Bacteroidota bacterium]
MASNNLYERQAEELGRAKAFLETESVDQQKIKAEYNRLVDNFEETIGELKLITKVSDKLQNKLDKTNSALDNKNKELQETLDALTKAKAGRKAATIILALAVILFLLEEIFIEKLIDNYSGGNVWFSLGAKGAIALGLKPLEGFLERILLDAAYKNAKKQVDGFEKTE